MKSSNTLLYGGPWWEHEPCVPVKPEWLSDTPEDRQLQSEPRTLRETSLRSGDCCARTWRTFTILRGVLATVLACTGASASVTDAFYVTGILHCVFYRSSGVNLTNQTLPFEIRVAGHKWQLRDYELSGAHWTRGSDGVHIYHVFQDGEAARPFDAGMVQDGPMPLGGYPSALPWLAFASSSLFEDANAHLPFAPWADPYFEPAVCAYGCRVWLCAEPPYLPEAINFSVTAEAVDRFRASPYLIREGKSLSDIQAQVMRVQSQPSGFKGGTYRVKQWTNVSGLKLPLAFELLSLRPPVHAGRGSNSPVAARFTGSGIAYRRDAMTDALPAIHSKPVSVIDLRIRSAIPPIDAIRYPVTNAWIMDTNAPYLRAVILEKRASVSRYLAMPRRRFWVLAALAALAMLPCYLVVRLIKRLHAGGGQAAGWTESDSGFPPGERAKRGK